MKHATGLVEFGSAVGGDGRTAGPDLAWHKEALGCRAEQLTSPYASSVQGSLPLKAAELNRLAIVGPFADDEQGILGYGLGRIKQPACFVRNLWLGVGHMPC